MNKEETIPVVTLEQMKKERPNNLNMTLSRCLSYPKCRYTKNLSGNEEEN